MSYNARRTAILVATVLVLSLSSCAYAELIGNPAGKSKIPLKFGLDKKSLTPAQKKISGRVLALKEHVRPEKLKALGLKTPDELSDRFQRVDKKGDIQLYIYYTGNPGPIISRIKSAGGRVDRESKKMSIIQAWVPYDRIEELADLTDVKRISLPDYAVPRTGSKNSEGDAVLRANEVRARGLTGAGMKVGVISDGINGIAASQATGDIPPTYEAESTRADGDLTVGGTAAEGTAMMEIVYDVAPGAALAFSNPETSLDMAESIQLLDTKYNCDVIVDDLGYFGQSWFEDDSIAQAAKTAVSNGKIYVSACGNSADKNYYQCTFTGTDHAIGGVMMTVEAYTTGDCFATLYVPASSYAYVFLQWNEQFGSAINDYELYLTNSDGSVVYASSEAFIGSSDPYRYCIIYNSGPAANCYIVVRKYSGEARYLKLVSYGTPYRCLMTEYYTATGSIWGHPACDDVVATGAIWWNTPNNIETFSSQGPVRMDFPSLEYRQKPDLCGIDGVTVTGNGGFGSPFFGTSAAAPHIAALAALAWSLDSTQTNEAVRNKIQDNCVDLGGAGFDPVYGHGRADIYKALVTSDTTPPASPTVNAIPATTLEATMHLSGSKSSDTYWLKINGSTDNVTFTSAYSWEANRTLAFGANTFTVSALDFASNESTSATVETTRTGTPPINAPTIDPVPSTVVSNTLKLTGSMSSYTAALLINGSSAGVTFTSSVSWESERTLSLGLNTFTVVARDASSNESSPVTAEVTLANVTYTDTADGVSIIFPVGCSTIEPVVTVEAYPDPGSLGSYPPGRGLLGNAMRILCNVTSFLTPVTVTMPLPASSLNPLPYYWDAASSSWSNSGLVYVSQTSDTVTFTTTHFTVFALLGISGNISDIAVYPNPFRIGSSAGIVFDFLRGDEKINIYTVSGELVVSTVIPSGTFQWTWDCKNAGGRTVGEDIYIYLIRNGLGQKKTGKIAVVY